MSRLTARGVTTLGSGVSGDTTWEAFRYDGRGRLIVASDNDSFNLFTYDSLGRLTSERSHFLTTPSSTPLTSDPADNAAEARTATYAAYDKAGNLTDLIYPFGTWDTVTGTTAPYPLRRHVGYSYDALGRTASIIEKSDPTVTPPPSIAAIGYYGPSGGRERVRLYGNGTRADRTFSGYDVTSPATSNPSGSYGFGRTLTVSHTKPGIATVNLASFSYTWDRTQNRASSGFSADKSSGSYTDATAYGYDHAERLTSSTRTGGSWAKTTAYTLDPVHNRIKTNEGAADLTYWMNDAAPEPQDKQVNQYTRTPEDQNTYDLAGNLHEIVLDCKCDIASASGAGTTDKLVNTYDLTAFLARMGTTDPLADFNGDGAVNTPDLTYLLGRLGRACDYETATWDYQNRLVSYVGTTTGTGGGGSGGAGTKTHVYKYDALGRRIVKKTDMGSEYERWERFVWGGQSAWQMLVRETTETGMTAVTTFVYQPSAGYIDDVVAMRRDVDGPYVPEEDETAASGTAAAAEYWYHADDMFTVAALTDAAGAVAERYHYDDYGSVRILDGDFNLRVAGANGRIESAIGNPHGFTGREWDAESGLWQYRYRYMSPSLGRFVSRDPIGTWGDGTNRGHATAYVASSPLIRTDAFGNVSDAIDCHQKNPKITAKQCRDECDKLFDSNRERNLCKAACKLLKNATCNGLFEICKHMLRHRMKAQGEACLLLHNAMCSGK